MWKISLFMVGAIIITCPLSSSAAPPVNTIPSAVKVIEDTDINFEGVSVNDVDGNLASVQLSVKHGKLKINFSAGGGLVISGNESKAVTLTGSEIQINSALSGLSYQGDRNYRGPDTLIVVSTDSSTPNPEVGTDYVSLSVYREEVNGPCTSYTKGPNEGKHIGDWFKRLSVGNIFNYSLVQYNLADKKAALNTQAAGFGVAFRYYTKNQLAQAGTDDIETVPLSCRARTADLLDFNVAPNGELPKIGAAFSLAPTFYVFKDKNENDLGTQLALNLGFLNDFLTIGVGWNLSGPDAGEWFILAGPSVGFSF